MNPEIIFEDESVIALNKPAGTIVHPDGMGDAPSVTAWIEKNRPELKGIGGEFELASGGTVPRHGVAHRIDRDTSGVLLIAKSQASFEYLKKQFLERTVTKTYRTFLTGELPSERLSITLPIGRSAADFRQWTATDKTRGKVRDAETEFIALKRGRSHGEQGEEYTYAEVRPKTGRTHQIRVHAKAAGYPIVGDQLYGTGKTALGFTRLALHAYSLLVRLPSGEEKVIQAPIPQDFEHALEELRKAA